MSGEVVLLYVTAGSQEEALKIAKTLVEERLCACVNVFPEISSIYWWEGKVQEDREAVLLVKTRREFAEKVKSRILEIHSYTCPCILEIPVIGGHEAFIDWILMETRSS
ncbi:divalent-cation tolerance protein CutA [Thermosulfurimonas dismutans]|uniref:Periplasmic divalent cation tolerance protein CutA n=1 Tax=Thermosulfurimonas dismutans TaxID=999894 RepID=A0A179D6H5_9BACT|nr:divalent-cation tolerance protein CutA [Thermosulfurimonas dismutans]OAQ21563.1 Periplasmic divalent cation tolerance protein CutA [Thermosulfurimonas dismutans]